MSTSPKMFMLFMCSYAFYARIWAGYDYLVIQFYYGQILIKNALHSN